jgi:hypothetical protein
LRSTITILFTAGSEYGFPAATQKSGQRGYKAPPAEGNSLCALQTCLYEQPAGCGLLPPVPPCQQTGTRLQPYQIKRKQGANLSLFQILKYSLDLSRLSITIYYLKRLYNFILYSSGKLSSAWKGKERKDYPEAAWAYVSRGCCFICLPAEHSFSFLF